MKNPTFFPSIGISLVLALLILSAPACSSFKKGVKYYEEPNAAKAESIFKKKLGHRIYDPGARYYQGMLSIDKSPTIQAWLGIHKTFCDLAFQIDTLQGRQLRLLHKNKVTKGRIIKSKDNLEDRILDLLCTSGRIVDLDTLYAHLDCWDKKTALDSMRTIIVNRTIDPDVVVFADKDCRNSEDDSHSSAAEPEWGGAGWPCMANTFGAAYSISYHDATAIMDRYTEEVIGENYATLWEIRDNIWNIFLKDHSFADMDQFRFEHPRNPVSSDCWFDNARDTLSLGLLRPLLAFHRNNPHTGLDLDVCMQILCLDGLAEDTGQHTPEEEAQLEDIQMMFELLSQLVLCGEYFDTTELIPNVAYLAEKYPYHQMVFGLARGAANFFFTQGRMDYAKQVLTTLQPLFPDSAACAVELDFQTGRQPWFDAYATLLLRAGNQITLPEPATAWNTPDHDEYGLVSWGETDEVFFVRKNRETGDTKVMTSHFQDTAWTLPLPVEELSVAKDVVPLSVFSEGRLMILKSGGRLMESYRPANKRRWSEPTPMPFPQRVSGRAVLSHDGSFLLVEDFSSPASPLERPKRDLYMVKLGEDGRYGKMEPLGEKINLEEDNEGNPLLALGGRVLFFTSDREEGLGEMDQYSIPFDKPNDWSTAGEPVNLGMELNTIFEETGLTFFSEYTGTGYFDRMSTCTGDKDIYTQVIGKEAFPENALRLAGVVLDENRKPVEAGFMEFLPDYSLNAHSQPISEKGAYTFTIPDNTEVVRLFPEVPGYYSECDTTHFLANSLKGQIIVDTFIVTSFEYIRQNFKLEHSTFFTGTSVFDNPDKTYPELTRFARIATRMGAELDLTGHTDGTGEVKNNKQLSIDRAQSVKDFLVTKCGFDPEKIRVFGYGSSKPLCTNDTEEGRRCNRRVEVVFRMPEGE